MNKVIHSAKYAVLSMSLLFVVSCSDDEKNAIVEDQTVSATEVNTILETDDYSSVVDNLVTDLFQNGESSKSSKNEDCYVAEYSNTGFSIVFEECSIDGSENINGSLVVTYKVGEESSAFTATYSDLAVGSFVINGTRAFTMNSNTSNEGGNLIFDIVSDMSITLADGSVIEEMGTKNFDFYFDGSDFANSTLSIDGDWTVKADGNTYTVNVTTPLKSNFLSCGYATEGVMNLNKNGLGVTINFGDGTCDDVAMLIYPDGTEEEISLKDK